MSALFLALVLAAQPAECRLTVYSYNDCANRLFHSHSWAVFERGPEKVVISWGPAQGNGTDAIRTAVPGKNYSHEQTLTFAQRLGLQVRTYGPYKIRPELFDNAKQWAKTLDSGRVFYVLLDRHCRPDACNCVSALLLTGGVRPRTGLRHGYQASEAIVRHFRWYFLE